MDYKKKYEQALENLKKIKAANKDNKELVDFIEYEYPELKESEDERVRKTLIEHIKGITSWDYFLGISKEQMIAWLEKQDVLKPAGKTQVSEKLYERIRNICACIDDALSSETLVDVKDYLEMASVDAQSAFDMIENLGEQKPAWSEEDERQMQQIISDLEQCTVPGFPIYIGGIELEINWLKSLKQRMKGK